MDAFTENILARARERQKLLKDYSSENDANKLNKKSYSSEPNLKETPTDSQPNLTPVCLSEGNIPKIARQNSVTRVSSSIPGSPQTQLKTLNIQRDNFNMEIKLTSSDNVRVEVEIEEEGQSDDNDTESQSSSESGLRELAKNKLNRLGKLYAGGEEADISSPIHRSEERFDIADNEIAAVASKREKDEIVTGRRGLSRLADLAETINQWENDTTASRPMPQNITPKKTWKPPAPKPPTGPTMSPTKKSRAPEPPKNHSPLKREEKTPCKKDIQVVGVTPKQLKWDKNVLDTLESQGFTRTTSSSRLVYAYNSQENCDDKENEDKSCTVPLETITETKETPIIPTDKTMTVESPTKVPKSPTKTHSRSASGSIADRAAMFESNQSKNGKTASAKDPALLSVSERKALFEKNKGEALVPKAAFAMSIPAKKNEPTKESKSAVAKQNDQLRERREKTPVKHSKPQAPRPPVQNEPKASTTQCVGIASKMAALLESKTTISQAQIEGNSREERQKEMDLLLNRFNKNKKTPSKEIVVEQLESDDSDDENDDATEETAMIPEKSVKIIPSAPPMPPVPGPSRKSGEKRSLKASPKVAAVLEDVKRIKVSAPKVGKLYPNLSDIEATTETETENASPSDSNNSSFEEHNYESDDANTSFGREILQAVCKNQTPHKRPICEESSTSDISSVLDEMDEYLNEALDSDGGPTPPKCGRSSPPNQRAAQPSHSFHYKNFNSPLKPSPKKSIDPLTFIVEGDNVVPLTHTVSFYRKQQNEASKTPVRQISRQPIVAECDEPEKSDDYEIVQNKIVELQDEVNKQQMIISQTSQALNLCNCTPEFSGSTEQVEAEKVLLVATHRRQAALQELQRLKVEGAIRPRTEHAQNLPLEKGTLTISNIVLPMKKKYVTALAATGGKGHHVVCLIKCGEQVLVTKLVSTVANKSKNPELELYIPGTIEIKNIYSDFAITFELYCLQAHEEYLPHEVKYHINSKKTSSKLTPKKGKQESRLVMPLKESPAGPQAVRSPSFALMGCVVFSVQAVNKRVWSLINTPAMSPFEGNVEMRISCELAVSVEHRGFLTMFEDVSGFGAWHRRWCLLKGHSLSYWKYPDDERKMAPIDTIDLKNCVTKEVGPVSRDICARLHTLLLERERFAQSQDRDTLVMVCKGDKTIIRHLLSADTKEERVEWCNKFNSALTAIRMWGK